MFLSRSHPLGKNKSWGGLEETQKLLIIQRDPVFVCSSAGCRITQIHLLCGGIIPLLSALEMAMAKNADKIGLR